MTRSRSRARTGGQPPLIPTWVVTPENLPPGYVYTGGLRTQVNEDGSIGWAPHNAVQRSQFQAVVGSPGSLGDGWGPMGTINGITRECVGAGAIDGHNYVDVRYFGTSTAASAHAIQPNASVPFGTGAVAGETVSASAFVQLIAGTFPVSPQLNLQITERAANASFTASSVTSITALGLVAGGPAVMVSHTRVLTGASTVYFDPAIRLDAGIGFTMDFTIRVWAFQANRGPLLPCIPSNGGGAYLPRTNDYSDSMAPVLGPELVTDGAFSTAGAWSFSTGAAVAGGLATASSMAQFGIISQATPTVAGRLYRVEFDVVSITAGAVRAIFHGSSQISLANVSSVGRYSAVLVATSNNTSIALQSATSTPLTGQFDNLSVREITGYAGARRGIKYEAQATNLLPNSEALGVTIGAGQASAPTGWVYVGQGATWSTVGAGIVGCARYIDVRLQGTLTALNPYIDAAAPAAITITPGAQYTASVFAQLIAGTPRNVYCALRFGTDAGGYVSDAGGTIRPLSSAPWMYTVTGAPAAGGTRGVLRFTIQGAVNDVVDVTIRIWAPQLEVGTVATSYIPTYGSSASRAAEVLYWPTSAITGWVDGPNRTMAVEASTRYNTHNGVLERVFELYNESSTQFEYLARQGANTATFGFSTQGWNAAGYFGDGPIKLAVATDATNSRLRSSQGAGTQTVAGSGLAGISRLYVGNRITADRGIRGSIYRLAYYPRAATDAQLQALTV
jgi:hypothetical protein